MKRIVSTSFIFTCSSFFQMTGWMSVFVASSDCNLGISGGPGCGPLAPVGERMSANGQRRDLCPAFVITGLAILFF